MKELLKACKGVLILTVKVLVRQVLGINIISHGTIIPHCYVRYNSYGLS